MLCRYSAVWLSAVGEISLRVVVVVEGSEVGVRGVGSLVRGGRCVTGRVGVEELREERKVWCVGVDGGVVGGIVIVDLQVAWVNGVANGLTCKYLG